MRARAGDPPRTMPQKVLGGRCADSQLRGEIVDVKVDQVILARAPMRAFGEALALGLKKTPVELAMAYDGGCVTDNSVRAADAPTVSASELVQAGIFVAKPGIGFPAPVHLERFAAPARFAVTDDPRVASVGGCGMLTLVVSPGQLGQALAHGTVSLRPPRSIQVLLAGRLRPFIGARDLALELIRRDVGEIVQRIEAEHRAPVIIEFAGPSARHLSVAERAILCGVAPQLGAAGAMFVSDEKTEVFLRDQRRSKAHRGLVPDAGAPCDEVVTIDLSAIDPLIMYETGQVRPVRDLAGTTVHQAVLGGDGGVTLKDMLTAAALLKSKRVPPQLDLLLAPPSRQMLEVMAQSGALADLIATGGRVIEPDRRVLTGELYPPVSGEVSVRTLEHEPRTPGHPSFLVASAETVAYAVATGAIGDPRGFKRPVRVTVPRALPTDDVLVLRDRNTEPPSTKDAQPVAIPDPAPSWDSPATFELVQGLPPRDSASKEGRALLLASLDEVRRMAQSLEDFRDVRAIIAPFIPSALVPLFAGAGIAAFGVDGTALAAFKGQRQIGLPVLDEESDSPIVNAKLGKSQVKLSWLAIGQERCWTRNGTSRPRPAPPKAARRSVAS